MNDDIARADSAAVDYWIKRNEGIAKYERRILADPSWAVEQAVSNIRSKASELKYMAKLTLFNDADGWFTQEQLKHCHDNDIDKATALLDLANKIEQEGLLPVHKLPAVYADGIITVKHRHETKGKHKSFDFALHAEIKNNETVMFDSWNGFADKFDYPFQIDYIVIIRTTPNGIEIIRDDRPKDRKLHIAYPYGYYMDYEHLPILTESIIDIEDKIKEQLLSLGLNRYPNQWYDRYISHDLLYKYIEG